MSNFKTTWTLNADGNLGQSVDAITGKVNALDTRVQRHKDAFGGAMASNRQSAFSLGDGIEEVAGRIHPALSGIVSDIRKIGTGLLSSLRTPGGMGSLNASISSLHLGSKAAGGGIMSLGTKVADLVPSTGAANSGLGSMLGNLMKLGGPEGAAVVAVLGAIAAGLAVSTMEAASFNHEFRQLSNLNLDKADAAVFRLRDAVLDDAFDNGIDPEKMSRGFFEFQSVTGKYGDEVERTSNKVADFSKGYLVDFNKMLESTGQASKAFNFGDAGVDRFLASTVKTVQTGKTTFEQLANVRSEYFDSAAGAGFDFESADKVFAAYSVGAKSVDVAATQVKETFRGLSDAKVIGGLKAQGVEVFDPLTHKIRTMDDITGDLVRTFSTARMSDEAFAKIKSEIGGGDGISMLLNKARSQGEQFLGVFKAFDSTPVNFKKALDGANKDVYTMWETTKARLSVSMIRLGTEILPHVVSALNLGNEVLQAFSGHTEGISSKARVVVTVFKGLGGLMWLEFQQVKAAITVALAPILLMIEAAKDVYKLAGMAYDWGTGRDREGEARRARIGAQYEQGRGELRSQVTAMSGTDAFRTGRPEAVLAQMRTDFKGSTQGTVLENMLAAGGRAGQATVLHEIAATMREVKAANPDAQGAGRPGAGYIADLTDGGGRKATSALGDLTKGGGGTVMAEGRSVRNIQVSIQQLVGEFTVNTTSVRENPHDIRRQVEAVLVESVRNAEITLGD